MVDFSLATVGNFLGSLSPADGITAITPLILFVIGMVVYAIFIHKFYGFIAKKNIFHLGGRKPSTWSKVGYGLKYVFVYPIVIFIWFFVIAVLLSILSHVLTIGDIFLISMAVTATIRITAYYSEDLSRDIAKLIPLALLGIFLLDISSIATSAPMDVVNQLPSVGNTLVYYFVFIVAMEIVLKILNRMVSRGPRLPTKTPRKKKAV